MYGKDHSDEISCGSEKHYYKPGGKENPYEQETKNLAQFCSCASVFQKVELDPDKIGYLSEETSKQSVVVAWYVLTAYGKI